MNLLPEIQDDAIHGVYSIARPQVLFITQSGGDPVEEILKIRSRSSPQPVDIRRALDKQVRRIQIRSQAGNDFEGKAFKPYSPDYYNRKTKKLGSANPVNLRSTGDMLDYLRSYSTNNNQGSIGWDADDQARRGQAHCEGGTFLPVRDFLSNTAEELNQIAEDIYDQKRKREGY